MVLSAWSRKQTAKFAMETAHIHTTRESSHVEITNEDTAHHFLRYQGYCSLWIHFTRPNSQPRLLCENTEAVIWRCAWRKAWTLANDWILRHDTAPAHKTLPVKEFLAKNSVTEMNIYLVSLIWLRITCGCFQKKVCRKGTKISGYWRHPKQFNDGTAS
jgi:hypothetical protein